MSIRLTEEEAKELGFVKDPKGNWQSPQRASLAVRNSRPPANVERAEAREVARPPARPEKVERRRRKGFSKFNPNFVIHIRVYTFYELDPDGIYPKWIIDKFVDEGILPGDSCRHVREIRKSAEMVESTAEERTVITIEELMDEVV